MSCAVKEIFYTLQGEGAQTGRPAVFCRFTGCNLWSGREADRARAVCAFCDTDFVGTDRTDGGRYPDAEALADRVASLWPPQVTARFVVCDPRDFAHLAFRRFSVQPMDGPSRARNTELAMAFCQGHPHWQLSLQTHKLVGFR